MAIIEERTYQPLSAFDDPDDYRPESKIAFVIDPARADGRYVKGLLLLFEQIAPGDRIPLHTHTIEEAVVIEDGEAEVTVGGETRTVRAGAVVFVPPGTPHGTRNAGRRTLRLHGIFPSSTITLRYLDRNPAPGTEGRPPQGPLSLDVRALLEGGSAAGGEK